MTELEEKVIRCYKKGITTAMMGNLKICPQSKSSKILREHGIIKMAGFKDYDTRNKFNGS